MEFLATVDFWVAVGQIILIDILLGGDNAVVIALACRKLPPEQRTKGIMWGTAGAIILRVVLIFFALQLLAIPFLKVVGALLLLWIGVKMLIPEHDEGHNTIEGNEKLWGAVKTVIVADFVMSVDNVIAIAGAAETSGGGQHTMALVIFGVLVSIPIIVWGSQIVLRLMDRFPLIITLGAMLLGWIAGTMFVTDPAFANPQIMPSAPKFTATDALRYGAGTTGALLVLLIGTLITRRSKPAAAAAAAVSGSIKVPGKLSRILLAVDGSENSLMAARQVLALRSELRDPAALAVHLINVQRPASGDVTAFVDGKVLEEYHREKFEAATAQTRAALEEAGVTFETHYKLGIPGQTISDVARTLDADMVVVGASGLGSNAIARLGSVAVDTLEHATMPVLVVAAQARG